MAPVFEDDIDGQLVAFVHQRNDQDQDDLCQLHSSALKRIFLDGLRSESPIDALPYFWQPARGTNHQLLLPPHPRQHELRSGKMTLYFFLDYLKTKGQCMRLDPIVSDEGLNGQDN